MLDNEEIDQVDSFAYIGSVISKDGWCSENVKSRIAEVHGIFFQLKIV